MANYQKYLFDNFVIKSEENDDMLEQDELSQDSFSEEIVEGNNEEAKEEAISEPQPEEIIIEQPQVIEHLYSEEEFNNAIKVAEEMSYERGFQAALNEETNKQNILLEDIKNQLMVIFASSEQNNIDLEKNCLRFMVATLCKILPTLEKEKAVAEVQNFLSENFATFAKQEILSFSFNPTTASAGAKAIGKLAEQHDFEGKISVHKDESLGMSDCRVEWKSGGSERNVSKIMEQVEDLIQISE